MQGRLESPRAVPAVIAPRIEGLRLCAECVQDIFISLSLIPKHPSHGCVLWGGAGAAVFLRPKLNIVTFLDFLDLFFSC